MPLGLNGVGIPGVFERNVSAELPDSTVSYEKALAMQKMLTVPQTAYSNITSGGLAYSVKIVNGMKTYVVENPTGRSSDWNDSEIFFPPEEILAKDDVKRQKDLEQKMISELSPEQKEMLRKLNAGELMPKPNLIEESKRMNLSKLAMS